MYTPNSQFVCVFLTKSQPSFIVEFQGERHISLINGARDLYFFTISYKMIYKLLQCYIDITTFNCLLNKEVSLVERATMETVAEEMSVMLVGSKHMRFHTHMPPI